MGQNDPKKNEWLRVFYPQKNAESSVSRMEKKVF
jgi:hypothetical protein